MVVSEQGGEWVAIEQLAERTIHKTLLAGLFVGVFVLPEKSEITTRTFEMSFRDVLG